MVHHKTAKIVIDGKEVDVDEEFANLILELHRLGLNTNNCCQGGAGGIDPSGFAYISFQLSDDCIFDYYSEKKVLTLRWNRSLKKFMPVLSYIHIPGGVKNVDELIRDSEPLYKMRPTKDERYMGIAKDVARGSTCLRAMVGAIIVKDDVVVSMGYVGSARGEPNCCDTGICERSRLNIPAGQNYELCKSLHAEMNAVINAARTGSSGILGGKMYLYIERLDGQKKFHRGMCVMCVRTLKNAGIKTVLYKEVAGDDAISDIIVL